MKHCYESEYRHITIKKLQNKKYYVEINYYYLSSHNFQIVISNSVIILCFYNNYFKFIVNNKLLVTHNDCDDFTNFCDNLKDTNNNHCFNIDNLICVDDIFDKMDCDLINNLDPILYKMFITIFNKPKMKNANSVTINN